MSYYSITLLTNQKMNKFLKFNFIKLFLSLIPILIFLPTTRHVIPESTDQYNYDFEFFEDILKLKATIASYSNQNNKPSTDLQALIEYYESMRLYADLLIPLMKTYPGYNAYKFEQKFRDQVQTVIYGLVNLINLAKGEKITVEEAKKQRNELIAPISPAKHLEHYRQRQILMIERMETERKVHKINLQIKNLTERAKVADETLVRLAKVAGVYVNNPLIPHPQERFNLSIMTNLVELFQKLEICCEQVHKEKGKYTLRKIRELKPELKLRQELYDNSSMCATLDADIEKYLTKHQSSISNFFPTIVYIRKNIIGRLYIQVVFNRMNRGIDSMQQNIKGVLKVLKELEGELMNEIDLLLIDEF